MPKAVWTAREAMACAYCWAEFNNPENTGLGSPEAYWLSITEHARNNCRRVANRMMLLAVARGQALAMHPPGNWDAREHVALGEAMGIKAHWRVSRAINGVWAALKARRWPAAYGMRPAPPQAQEAGDE